MSLFLISRAPFKEARCEIGMKVYYGYAIINGLGHSSDRRKREKFKAKWHPFFSFVSFQTSKPFFPYTWLSPSKL